MSASSSLSWATASKISSPSSCEAASTRSAIWAGCRRASRRCASRSLEEGTWATNGSSWDHSTNSARSPRWPRKRRGSKRRQRAARLGSMPATRQTPPSQASSTSRAATSRAVLTLIRLCPSTSARNSTSPGRRSKRARLSLVVEVRAAAGSSCAMRSAGTNSSRPPMRAFSPVTSGRRSPWSSRAITSCTTPSLAPAESRRGLPATEDRCTTASAIATADSVAHGGPPPATLACLLATLCERLRAVVLHLQRRANRTAEVPERRHVDVRRAGVDEQMRVHRFGDPHRVRMAQPDPQPAGDDHPLEVQQVDGRGDPRAERTDRAVEHLNGQLVAMLERAGPDAARQTRAPVFLHQLEQVGLATLLLVQLAP